MALVIGSIDKMSGLDIYSHIERIKMDYLNGEKSYEIAKEEIAIFVEEINKRGKEIAKKHGKPYRNVTVGYVLR